MWNGLAWEVLPRFIRQVVRNGLGGGRMRLEKGTPGENAVVSYWPGKVLMLGLSLELVIQ